MLFYKVESNNQKKKTKTQKRGIVWLFIKIAAHQTPKRLHSSSLRTLFKEVYSSTFPPVALLENFVAHSKVSVFDSTATVARAALVVHTTIFLPLHILIGN